MHSINFYQELEDEFQCSGMCQAGLFYFSRDISEGPPVRTCFSKIKHVIERSAMPFARSTMVTGIVCLLLFFMHFGLYLRPKESDMNPPEFEPRAVNNDSIQVEMG